MTHSVSDDRYGKLRRRLDEVALRVDRGTISYDPTMSALTLIIEGEIPAPLFKRDMRKEAGWELISDSQHPSDITIADLERVSFLNFDEPYITGKELQKRARKLNVNLGQHTAEYLLEHQDEIPEEWRGTYIVFPGTVWRNSDGKRNVPHLSWYGGRWFLDFHWLDGRFRSGDRFVRLSK